MSNRDDDRAKLLADAFHEDWAAGPAANFARLAAGHARRRQRGRRASLAAIATAAAAVAVLLIADRPPTQSAPMAATPPPSKATGRGYEILSDEALLAQLRDRPLLIVKNEDGTRQFTVLTNE